MAALAILIKASLVIAAVAICHALVGRWMSASMRHQLWTFAAASLLLLPILTLTVPGWTAIRLVAPSQLVSAPIAGFSEDGLDVEFATPTASKTSTTPADNGALSAPRLAISWPTALGALYASGVLFLLARLVWQLFERGRFSRRAAVAGEDWERLLAECAQQLRVHRSVRLLCSRDRTIPMAFGVMKATILVPGIADNWSGDRRRAVLLHEMAHVERHDCFTQVLAAVVCAIYWVHPGVWWMAHRLRLERELACDDLVLSTGASPCDYASHLLEIAYSFRVLSAPALSVSMADSRQLERRLLALLDASRNRATPTCRTRLATAALVMTLLVPVAAARATSAPAAATERLGYHALSIDTLVDLRDHGVSPQFIRGLMAEGLARLSAEDLIKARDHGVSVDFVRDLRTLGYQGLSIDSLIRLVDHGVSPAYISEMNQLGYASLQIDDLISLRDRGVTPDLVRRANTRPVHGSR